MMKKIMVAVFVLVCMTIVSGCSDSSDIVDVTVKEIPHNVSENEADEKNKLSHEQIIDIYLENYDVWKFDGKVDYVPNAYGYCLLDLDFDGICELIASENGGTGFFSFNNFYKVNPNNNTVEKIETSELEEYGGYDLYFMREDVKLLKSTADESQFYYCQDYVREGMSGYDIAFGKLYMQNGKIITDVLFMEYHGVMYENPESFEDIYYIVKNGKSEIVSEETYREKMTDFENKNVDSGLIWECIDASVFDKMSEEEQRKTFTQSYMTFSYDGVE